MADNYINNAENLNKKLINYIKNNLTHNTLNITIKNEKKMY